MQLANKDAKAKSIQNGEEILFKLFPIFKAQSELIFYTINVVTLI